MNRITEAELIAYLYGECTEAEARHIEKAISEDAALQQEYQQLRLLRKTLAKAETKEVVEPNVQFGNSDIVLTTMSRSPGAGWPGWQWLGIAASIALILMAGYFSKASMSIKNGSFELSFGEPKLVEQELSVGLMEDLARKEALIEKLLDQDYVNRLASLESTLHNYDEHINNRLGSLNELYRQEMNDVISRRLASDETIKSWLAQLEEANLQSFESFTRVANVEQQLSIVNLLNEFSIMLENQRQQDLLEIQNGLNAVARETQQIQMETAQAFSSLGANPIRTNLK
jgi:hypothetical protein